MNTSYMHGLAIQYVPRAKKLSWKIFCFLDQQIIKTVCGEHILHTDLQLSH